MQLHIHPTPQQAGNAAAKLVAQLSAQAVSERGQFTLAISGGSLPKLISPALAAEPLKSHIDWSKWHLFFADERCVPLDHPDSNYRLAREHLFEHVSIPAQQIYPIDAALSPAAAATAYEDTLRQIFPVEAGQFPQFDVILLGMGPDGHTASLFPNHPLLNEQDRWVAAIFNSPKPPPERITLTLPVLNNARQVAFIVAGAGKAELLPQVLGQIDSTTPLPAQLVQPAHPRGQLHWFVDESAAATAKPYRRRRPRR